MNCIICNNQITIEELSKIVEVKPLELNKNKNICYEHINKLVFYLYKKNKKKRW